MYVQKFFQQMRKKKFIVVDMISNLEDGHFSLLL